MTDEVKLPDGLQLAVDLLDDTRAREFIKFGAEVEGEIMGAIDAIRSEHAQRLTIKRLLAQWKHFFRAQELLTKIAEQERDELRARLAELELQEPICAVQMTTTGGRLQYNPDATRLPEHGMPLYARPVPAQAAPMSDERIDAIAELVIKGMPDGISGFLRGWGWMHFARELLTVCAGHYRPVPAIPAGWKLVPVEPTPEMLEAFHQGFREQLGRRKHGLPKKGFTGSAEQAGLIAMLAAAPEAAR